MGCMRCQRSIFRTALLLMGSLTGWAQLVPFTGVFSEIPLPARYVGAAAGNWDRDSSLDLLVVTEDRRLLCYSGRRDGTFAAPVATNVAEALPPVQLRSSVPAPLVAVGNEVFMGNSQCGFSLRATLSIRVSGSGSFGGGFSTDVVGSVPGTNTIQTVSGSNGGPYGTVRTLSVTGDSPKAVHVNGDSYMNLVVPLSPVGSQVWLADTKGGFTKGQTLSGSEWSNFRGAADLNGDGRMDLLFEQGSVALGLGNGNFALSTIPSCRTGGYSGPCDAGAVIADFNLDGRNDIIVAPYDPASGGFEAVFRLGTISESDLNPEKLRIPATVPDGLIAGDWNGDTAIDLAVASATSIRIYMNMIETRVISSAQTPWGPVRRVSRGSLASVYGVNYTTTIATAANPQDLPQILGGVQLRLTDESAKQIFAPLLCVAPQQINFVVPDSIGLGWSKVELVATGTTRTIGWMEVVPLAPSLFYLVTEERTNADGSTSSVPLNLDAANTQWSTPIVVAFYGTGFQGATVDNTRVNVGFSSLQPLRVTSYPGLPGVQVIVAQVQPGDVDYDDDAYGSGVSITTQGITSNGMYTGFW